MKRSVALRLTSIAGGMGTSTFGHAASQRVKVSSVIWVWNVDMRTKIEIEHRVAIVAGLVKVLFLSFCVRTCWFGASVMCLSGPERL